MENTVLIVEDEFVVANALRLILVQAGYRVSGIAASAEEAEELLRKRQPDLVILDIRLSGKQSGIDLGRKLSAENIAFIYLSANSSQKVLEEAKTTEPYGFLIKPFREKDLLVTLDIAWYRHKHSLENKLRQEELLQKQLTEVITEGATGREKVLKILGLMQPHISFDLVIPVSKAPGEGPLISAGYLRTGYDEYQAITEKELMSVTGAKGNLLSMIMENSDKASSLQKILFDRFKVESFILFPFILSNGSAAQLLFGSRQRNFYTKNHTDLLGRVKLPLALAAEKIINNEALTAPSIKKERVQAGYSQFKTIIGHHPLLLAALDLTVQVAPHNTSVLILGESGTGKEQVALSIHSLSARKSGPFVKVNCAAIPSTLMESELFGHEKGAFTGAIEKKKGKFEQADGGTIFLDEIGELPLDMQVKLLRVLQEKEIETVGGNAYKTVNVRIVAATNRNLEKEVADGNFRLDLYYRLNVFPITLPALRDRKSDIVALTDFFARKFSEEFRKEFTGISARMAEEIFAYNWPGNIRELENVLERAVILNDGKSPLELRQSLVSAAGVPAKTIISTLEDIKQIQKETEKEYILSILRKTEGRIRGPHGAAELLDIKPTTLESKMAKLGITKGDFLSPNGEA